MCCIIGYFHILEKKMPSPTSVALMGVGAFAFGIGALSQYLIGLVKVSRKKKLSVSASTISPMTAIKVVQFEEKKQSCPQIRMYTLNELHSIAINLSSSDSEIYADVLPILNGAKFVIQLHRSEYEGTRYCEACFGSESSDAMHTVTFHPTLFRVPEKQCVSSYKKYFSDCEVEKKSASGQCVITDFGYVRSEFYIKQCTVSTYSPKDEYMYLLCTLNTNTSLPGRFNVLEISRSNKTFSIF